MLRQTHFREEWLSSIPCEQLFVNIMSEQREASIFSLAKYINSGVNLRTDTDDFSD